MLEMNLIIPTLIFQEKITERKIIKFWSLFTVYKMVDAQ